MKIMKKISFLFVFAALAFTFVDCSKSSDPTPAQKTALDSVKSALSGTWKFKSVTVTQTSNSKTGTAVDCGKAQLSSAGFSNTNWQQFTVEPNFTYTGSNSKVTIDYPCLSGDPTDAASFIINQISSEVFNIQFSDIGYTNLMTFQIKTSDIKTSNIKVTLISIGTISMNGYLTTYQFIKL